MNYYIYWQKCFSVHWRSAKEMSRLLKQIPTWKEFHKVYTNSNAIIKKLSYTYRLVEPAHPVQHNLLRLQALKKPLGKGKTATVFGYHFRESYPNNTYDCTVDIQPQVGKCKCTHWAINWPKVWVWLALVTCPGCIPPPDHWQLKQAPTPLRPYMKKGVQKMDGRHYPSSFLLLLCVFSDL